MRLTALFLRWYFLRAPLRIIRGYGAYAMAFLEIVPFGFLLLTLLSPWKNIADHTQIRGLDIKHITEALALSLLARGVGCVIRILTIALGLVFHVLLLTGTIVYLLAWIGFPLMLIYGGIFIFSSF
ncbi:MAG: hypothetical protein PHZ00_05860 [Candidatus Peribacteraceae bacterium]|nr:hypothetical protein [Candidatus Peribacteraceae bacterium]